MPPLRLHPANPRYFTDASGRAVLLAGSHHWDVLVDGVSRPEPFDFDGYLDRLEAWGHDAVRLWTHEGWLHDLGPLPYLRSGTGLARDGRAKFDLERFDPEYFGRLRERVERATARGFAVIVMLFNGWSIHSKGFGNPWDRHPFNRENNLNGVDGDPDGRGEGSDVHSLRVPEVLRVQERFVRQVHSTLRGLDPLLWEISNESPGSSYAWQLHWVEVLRRLEAEEGAHPVGLSACFPGGKGLPRASSPVDWIAPGNSRRLRSAPPPAPPERPTLLDTDHLWGIGGDAAWVWKAVLRGYHLLYMDPLDDDPVREGARRAMGQAVALSRRIDFARLAPDERIASSGYALATRREPAQIVAYLPRGRGTLDLRGLDGSFELEWLDPREGTWRRGDTLAGGARRKLAAPGSASERRDAVLHAARS